jgi:hypothetical protein
MLAIFTLIIMAVVAVAQYRNALFLTLTMLLQVLIAGFVAFGFWEPIADELDAFFRNGPLSGYEDCMALTGLFVVTLGLLRLVTNRLNKQLIDFPNAMQHAGGPVIGLVIGYLVAGFLICVFQTLPLDESFLGFTPRNEKEPLLRSYLPADRVWLAIMRRAGAYPLCAMEDNPSGETLYERYATFDRDGTFELRYLRYRRHSDIRPPLAYEGEFEKELGRKK